MRTSIRVNEEVVRVFCNNHAADFHFFKCWSACVHHEDAEQVHTRVHEHPRTFVLCQFYASCRIIGRSGLLRERMAFHQPRHKNGMASFNQWRYTPKHIAGEKVTNASNCCCQRWKAASVFTAWRVHQPRGEQEGYTSGWLPRSIRPVTFTLSSKPEWKYYRGD